MLYYDISGLSLTQIRIFLCAMESASFTEAARKLNFTQSMVSKTIAALENDTGLILFLRQKNQSIPTPAARTLYEEWKKFHALIEHSIEKAHSVQNGIQVELKILMADTGDFGPELLRASQEFSKEYPYVLLRYEEHSIGEVHIRAKKQGAHVIITAGFDEDALRSFGYSSCQLFQTNLAIFVHRSHPFFNRDSVSFPELRAEKFITLSPSTHPNYIPLINRLGAEHGFTPRIAMQVPNVNSFKMNLLTRQGIALADSCTELEHEDIRMIPISGLDEDVYNGVTIAWLDDNLNARKFSQIVCEMYHNDME